MTDCSTRGDPARATVPGRSGRLEVGSLGVLDGKAGIITGAARGVGKGMATALAKEGMAVTLTDVRADTVEETAASGPRSAT